MGRTDPGVAELTGPLVAGRVDAGAGDVALAGRVAAEQVVHPDGDGVVVAGFAACQVSHGEHHEVVEDPAVRTPVPSGGGCVRLTPRLPSLQVEQLIGDAPDAVTHAVVAATAGEGQIEPGGRRHPVEIETVRVEGVGGVVG